MNLKELYKKLDIIYWQIYKNIAFEMLYKMEKNNDFKTNILANHFAKTANILNDICDIIENSQKSV